MGSKKKKKKRKKEKIHEEVARQGDVIQQEVVLHITVSWGASNKIILYIKGACLKQAFVSAQFWL